MRLGAHVSTGGALHRAVDRAVAIGCDCLQIFVGNPRQWRRLPRPPEDLAEFRRKRRASGLEPLVAHSSYLVNLASPDPALRRASVASLVEALRLVESLEGLGVVTHVGSRAGAQPGPAIERVAGSVREVLARTRSGCLLLENSAGATLGGSFEELAAILEELDGDPRVGFCLDTAHLFAAGWDLRTAAGVKRALDEFAGRVGLDRLRLFHLNDSRAERGSGLDRHENIGEGRIGARGFRALLADRRVRHLAGVIETPGFDHEGPDRRNLEILRSLEPRRGTAREPSAPRRAGRRR